MQQLLRPAALFVAVTVTLMTAALAAPVSRAEAATPASVTRIAGPDRYATSVETSRRSFTSASTVIIATGLAYPDALAAAPLAGAVKGPVLLVPGTSLPANVSAEISRLGATRALIAGGPAAVASGVADSLTAKGLTVERIGSTTAYGTATELAKRALSATGRTKADTVFIARGDSFADALSVSSIAYDRGFPVLLVRTDSIPAETLQALRDFAPAHIVIAGGTPAVSSGVETTLKGLCPDVARVSGPNRYATSAAIAAYAVGKTWADPAFVGMASGDRFPDALGGGPATGGKRGALLLTNGNLLSAETKKFLDAHVAHTLSVNLYGGIPALSTTVESGVRNVYAPPAKRWVGFYVPGAPASISPLTSLESQAGVQASVSNYFQASTQGFTLSQATNAANSGATPLITLEFWNGGGVDQPSYRLANIANGSFDTYLRTYARSAKSFGKTVWLRPFHEMNGNWYPWCGTVNGNSSADFIAAWRHVRNIFTTEGATNVKFVWSPNVDSVPNTTDNAIARYWPGDNYVDLIALDGYNFGTSSSSWRSFGSVFGSAYAAVTPLSAKPVFIAETACGQVGGDKAAWITDMFNSIPTRYPRIVGVTWFNANKERDWRVESSTSSLNAFKTGAARFVAAP